METLAAHPLPSPPCNIIHYIIHNERTGQLRSNGLGSMRPITHTMETVAAHHGPMAHWQPKTHAMETLAAHPLPLPFLPCNIIHYIHNARTGQLSSNGLGSMVPWLTGSA
eukprot:scaffold111179_cov64-Cyclotella_meneghiniana.AAC.8